MQITEITVHAGRVVNHPLEQYSNLKPSLSLKATIDSGEDVAACVKQLQAQAELLIEEHKHKMLSDIRALDRRMRLSSDIAAAKREIETLTERVARAETDLSAEIKGEPEPQAELEWDDANETTIRRRY